MPGELKDIATIIMGQSPAGNLVSDDPSSGLPLLNGPSEFGDSHPIPVQWTRDAPRIAEPGDLLFCVRGSTTGRMNWADQRYAVGRGIAAIRPNEPNTADAMRGLIEAQLPALLQAATGSTFPNVSRDQLTELPLQLGVDVALQTISAFFAFIREKIDLNRKMAATLEEMARALFKSWFVDFDPVHAIVEGRTTGLPADITALFPTSFDNEGLPDSWRSGSLVDFADTNSESWKASSHPEEVEYVDLSNCKWGNIDGTTQYSWAEAPSRARRVARPGDTIFGTVRPGNGSYAFVGRDGLTVSTGFAVLRPKKEIYREMVYFAATNLDNIRWLEQLAAGHGGAYPAVNPDKVSATAVVVPCEKVAEAFAATTADMIDRIESLKQEAAELEQLRDTLLPQLLSGELRVADAESAIAAA